MQAKLHTFYHGTDARYRDAILREGLIPGKGKGGDTWAMESDPVFSHVSGMLTREPSVYVSPYIEESRWFAALATDVNNGTESVIFRIDLPVEMAEKMRQDEHDRLALRYVGSIPARYISVAETISNPDRVRAENAAFALRVRLGEG